MPEDSPNVNQLTRGYAEYIIRSKALTTEAAGRYAHTIIARSPISTSPSHTQDDRGSPEKYEYLCTIHGLSHVHLCWFAYTSLVKSHRDHLNQQEGPVTAGTGAASGVGMTVQAPQEAKIHTILRPDPGIKKELSINDTKQLLRMVTLVDKVYMWYNPLTRQGSGPGISLETIEQRFLNKSISAYFDEAFKPQGQSFINPTGGPVDLYPYSTLPSLSNSSPIYTTNVQYYSIIFTKLKEKSHSGIIIPTEEEILYIYALVTWRQRPLGECYWERIIFVPNGVQAFYSYIYVENCLMISKACRLYKNSFMLARKILNSDLSSLFSLFASHNRAQTILPVEDSQQLYNLHLPYSLFLRTSTNVPELLANIKIYQLFRPFFGRAIHDCLGSSWFSVIDTMEVSSSSTRPPRGRSMLLSKIFGTFLRFLDYAKISKAYATPFWDSHQPSADIPYNAYFMQTKNTTKRTSDGGKKNPRIYQFNTPYYEPEESFSFQPITDVIREKMNAAPPEVSSTTQSILESNKAEGCNDDTYDYSSFPPIERPILVITSNDERIANWSSELINIQLNQYALYCPNEPASIDFVWRQIFTAIHSTPQQPHIHCDICKANNCPCQQRFVSPDCASVEGTPAKGKPSKAKKDSELSLFPVHWFQNSDLLTSFLESATAQKSILDIPSPRCAPSSDSVTLQAAFSNSARLFRNSSKGCLQNLPPEAKNIILRGYGSQFKAQPKDYALGLTPIDSKSSFKQQTSTSTSGNRKPAIRAIRSRQDFEGAADSYELTPLEKVVCDSYFKMQHLCGAGPQKNNNTLTKKSQIHSNAEYHSRWITCSPLLTTSTCACSIVSGLWCMRCVCNFKTGTSKVQDGHQPNSTPVPMCKTSEVTKVLPQRDLCVADYIDDCHNYYIKQDSEDDATMLRIVKEPFLQAFMEPSLKRVPSDTVVFCRNGKNILSIRRKCRQLPFYIIVASFPAVRKLFDVLSQIPFEVIFIEETSEMASRQYEHLNYFYALSSKYRFFAGRREFPIFSSDSLSKLGSIPLTEKVPKELFQQALLSLNSMSTEMFQSALAILSFLLHIPKHILLNVFHLIGNAILPLFDVGEAAIKPMQILLTFALLDFLDANYLPEAFHSQIITTELSVYNSIREKNAPCESNFDVARALTNMQMYFAGYPRETVKVSTVAEYNHKCDEFYDYIRGKVTDSVCRNTPYRIFSVMFLHIQAYGIATKVAKIRIPAELLKQLNIALTPFGSIVLGKNGDHIAPSCLLNTVRCDCGLTCGCGLFAHNPDYVQSLESNDLHTSSKDVSGKSECEVDSSSTQIFTASSSRLSVYSTISQKITAELRQAIGSKVPIQPATIIFLSQTLDQMLLQRVFLDIDANVRRVVFDDNRPILLKRYTKIEVFGTIPKVTYQLYSTVIRYTIFQLLIYLWTDTVLSLGELYADYLRSNSSCFNELKEGCFFKSPVKYPLYIAQPRLMHISGLTNTFLHQNLLFSEHPLKLAKATLFPTSSWQAIFLHPKKSLVYVVPDIMHNPMCQFLYYAYKTKARILDLPKILVHEETKSIVISRFSSFLTSLDDDTLTSEQLILCSLYRAFISTFFDVLFTPENFPESIIDQYTDQTDQNFPPFYHKLVQILNKSGAMPPSCQTTDTLISVVPESLLLLLISTTEGCSYGIAPIPRRGKVTFAVHDFTTLIVTMPFVGTRPISHIFTKLCYEYQILAKYPFQSIVTPYSLQFVCNNSIEGTLLLTQQQSTHSLYGEVVFMVEALRIYAKQISVVSSAKKGARRTELSEEAQAEIATKLSFDALLHFFATASCLTSQQVQANIGNQMSKLNDNTLNLKSQNLYLIDPLVRTTVNAWLDGDLILQGSLQHIFLNVTTTLRSMIKMCKSKSDKELLTYQAMAVVKQTAAKFRQTEQNTKSTKQKEQSQSLSVDIDPCSLKMTLDASPFYIYYAGSPTVVTINPSNVPSSKEDNSCSDSPSHSSRSKDVAGSSKTTSSGSTKMRGKSIANSSKTPFSNEYLDKLLEAVTIPKEFRGSSAFSILSGNVVGTSSISAPLFSKIGRSFRKAEGPALTPTEFLYNYINSSVEQVQAQPSAHLTAGLLHHTFSFITQPPIPPALDSHTRLLPEQTLPRILPTQTRQNVCVSFKNSFSSGNYINSYVSALNPLYTLDQAFPICQECYTIYTQAESNKLQHEKLKLLTQYGSKENLSDSSATFSIPQANNHIDYKGFDSSQLYYCLICDNIFDPHFPPFRAAKAKDVQTIIKTYQSNTKPAVNPESIITPTSKAVFRQCKLYQQSSLGPQGRFLSDGIYQTNLSGLSYSGSNEHQSLCVQCIEEAGLPRSLNFQVYKVIRGLIQRHRFYHEVSTLLLDEYFLAYVAAAHSYLFSDKCVGYCSELRAPEVSFNKDNLEELTTEFQSLAYNYQYLLYGHTVCEILQSILYAFIVNFDGKDSNSMHLMAKFQKIRTPNQQFHLLFERMDSKTLNIILTSFFSLHIKKGSGAQSSIVKYSQILIKIYNLFKCKTISTCIDFFIPYTLYPIYSSLYILFYYHKMEKSILSKKWFRMYDITESVLHTIFKSADAHLIFDLLGYKSIYYKYYMMLRLLLLDNSVLLTNRHKFKGTEYSKKAFILDDQSAFLTFILRHTLFYNHSIISSPEASCYSHILIQFASTLLAYNNVHPCSLLNSEDSEINREYLLTGAFYGAESIFSDTLIIYHFLTHVPQLIALHLAHEDTTSQVVHRMRDLDDSEVDLCKYLLKTFTDLEFSVSHALADWGTIQFVPQLSYLHRLLRTKVRTISFGSPLSIVDTTLLTQYLNNNVDNTSISMDVFSTIFSCDYSWIYRLVVNTHQYEIPIIQDTLAALQYNSESDSPMPLSSTISDEFLQKICAASKHRLARCQQPFEKKYYGIANIRPYPHSVTKLQSQELADESMIEHLFHESLPINGNPISLSQLDRESSKQRIPAEIMQPGFSNSFTSQMYDSPLQTSLELPSTNSNLHYNIDRTESLDQPSLTDNTTISSPPFNSTASIQPYADSHIRMGNTPSVSKIHLDLFKDNVKLRISPPLHPLIPQDTLHGTSPISTKALSYMTLRTLRMLFLRTYPMDNQTSIFCPPLAFSKVQGILPIAFGDVSPDTSESIQASLFPAESLAKTISAQKYITDGKYVDLAELEAARLKPSVRLHACEIFLKITSANLHGGLFKYSYEPYQFSNNHTELDMFFLRYLANYMYIPKTEILQEDLLAVFLRDPVSGISLQDHSTISYSMANNFMVSGLATDGVEQQKLDSLVKEVESMIPEANRELFINVVTSVGVGLGTTPLEMYEGIVRTYMLLVKKEHSLPINVILQAASALLQILWLVVKKCRKLPDELRSYFSKTGVTQTTRLLYISRILQAKLKELSVRYNYFLFSFDWCTNKKASKYSSVFSRGLQIVPVVENYWIQCCNQYNEDFSLQDLTTQMTPGGVESNQMIKSAGNTDGTISPETAIISDIACSPAALAYRFLWNIQYYLPTFYYGGNIQCNSTSSGAPSSQYQQHCSQQGSLQQNFSIIRQYVLTVHPVSCSIDLAISYIDYMYECMIDPTYVARYQTTPMTMNSLFTIQEYGLTEFKNCWLYLTYCKIEFLEKFGLSMADIRSLETNPALGITKESIDYVQTIATYIHSAWSRLSDLKLLHAYTQYRSKYQQVLMEKREYNCSQVINTIQLAKILLPIFKQLTQLLEATYNNVFLSKDLTNRLFPTEALIQQRGVVVHPALEERWNAYYIHALQWQAVIPAFSDEFLSSFDILQRPRRVPTPELVTFTIKQFSLLIKDRWASILRGIQLPVSSEFIKERHKLLIRSLLIERTILVNLNEQYYNYDLNSIMELACNILQTSRSHVRLIAFKSHPENRLNEIFSLDRPAYSHTPQYSRQQVRGSSAINHSSIPLGASPQYHTSQRSVSAGTKTYLQQGYMPRGSPVQHAFDPASSGLIDGYFEHQRPRISGYPPRPGYDSPIRYSGAPTPPPYNSSFHRNAVLNKMSPYPYSVDSKMIPNQYYQNNGSRAPMIPGNNTRYSHPFPYDRPSSSSQRSQAYGIKPNHGHYQTPFSPFGPSMRGNSQQAYSSPLIYQNNFPDKINHPELFESSAFEKTQGYRLSISSYSETTSTLLKLLNNAFPSLINKESTFESSERILFSQVASLYSQDNLLFDRPPTESSWQYILGYISLVNEQPQRKGELEMQEGCLLNRIGIFVEKYSEVFRENETITLAVFCKQLDSLLNIGKNEPDHRMLIEVGHECAIFFLHQAYANAYEVRKKYVETGHIDPSPAHMVKEFIELCTRIIPVGDIFSNTDILLRKQLIFSLFIKSFVKQYHA